MGRPAEVFVGVEDFGGGEAGEEALVVVRHGLVLWDAGLGSWRWDARRVGRGSTAWLYGFGGLVVHGWRRRGRLRDGRRDI